MLAVIKTSLVFVLDNFPLLPEQYIDIGTHRNSPTNSIIFSDNLRLKVQLTRFGELLAVHGQPLSHSESPFVFDLTTQVQIQLTDQ